MPLKSICTENECNHLPNVWDNSTCPQWFPLFEEFSPNNCVNILKQDTIRQVDWNALLDKEWLQGDEGYQGSSSNGLLEAGVSPEDSRSLYLLAHSSEGMDPDQALSVSQLVLPQPARLSLFPAKQYQMLFLDAQWQKAEPFPWDELVSGQKRFHATSHPLMVQRAGAVIPKVGYSVFRGFWWMSK